MAGLCPCPQLLQLWAYHAAELHDNTFALTNGSVWHSGLLLVTISEMSLFSSLLSKQQPPDCSKGKLKYGKFPLTRPPPTYHHFPQIHNLNLSLPCAFIIIAQVWFCILPSSFTLSIISNRCDAPSKFHHPMKGLDSLFSFFLKSECVCT